MLADDQGLVRAGFRMLLDSATDISVVAEADNGGVAVALAREHRPDVVLMDLRMPEVDGVTATKLITSDCSLAGVRVVVLTTFDDGETVLAALRAGASGFLVKDVEPADLLQAVRVVARGDALLSPSVTRAVIAAAALPTPAPVVADPGPLTVREAEVVTLVGAGLSNDEIAAKLVVSPLTAKTHVSRAMTKVGARDRAQLVIYAYEHGLRLPRRAPRPARHRLSLPAMALEDPRLQQCRLACVSGYFFPPVPNSLDSFRASDNVAVPVLRALRFRMGFGAV
jgi:DNA-binding NarL/FixJ family response regulator